MTTLEEKAREWYAKSHSHIDGTPIKFGEFHSWNEASAADFARSVVREIVGRMRNHAEGLKTLDRLSSGEIYRLASELESEYGVDKC